MRDRLYRCLEGKLSYNIVDEGKLAAGHTRRDMWLKQKALWRDSQSSTLNKYKQWKPTFITAQDIQEFSSWCIKFTSPTHLVTHPLTTELFILKCTLAKWLHTLTFKLLLFDFRSQVPTEKNLMTEACEILFDYPQTQEEKVALNYIFKLVSQL